MQTPLKIDYESLTPSPALNAVIARHVARLEKLAGTVMGCLVTVTAPHRHQRQGRAFDIHIRLRLPGRELVVSHAPEQAHEDAAVAVRDAFDRARRQLEDFVRVRRGDVKTHPRRSRAA